MQYEIITPGPLLNNDGMLNQKGYSTSSILTYNREHINAFPWQIKEWDFYQVNNADYCMQMTIGHVGYAGHVSVKLFEFATGLHYEITKMLVLPFNRLKMPRSAELGDLHYRSKDVEMHFEVYTGGRRLRCRSTSKKHPTIEVDVTLSQPDLTSLVIATPFTEKNTQFYYNHKTNCMPATGTVKIGDGEKEYIFEPDTAFGLIDWGRGVWPFSHEWIWGSGSSYVNGKRFGFNIGFGFGDTSAATENMLFYDGKAHKISKINITLNENGFMAPKKITSDDGRFEMIFTPIYDQQTATKMLFVDNRCHQVFAKFDGKVVLDDGEVLEINNLVGFVEHAINNW